MFTRLNHKKAIAALTAFILVVLPIVAFAASYTSTLYFDTTLTGQWRSYDPGDITIEVNNPTATGQGPGHVTTYSVSLQKKTLLGHTVIGTASMSRLSSDSATWTEMNKGEYRFYFLKAFDGVLIESNDVRMYN